MSDEELSIQDLVDRTGLPRRTIHFYIQQGIIPPPTGAGLGAKYQQIHLTRLRLIPLLRASGQRLDEIRKKFQNLSPDQLGALLEKLGSKQPEQPARPNAALLTSTPYLHYNLPFGMILMVPADLNPEDRIRANGLIYSLIDHFSTEIRPSETNH